jgi:uncharacterized membrane protein
MDSWEFLCLASVLPAKKRLWPGFTIALDILSVVLGAIAIGSVFFPYTIRETPSNYPPGQRDDFNKDSAKEHIRQAWYALAAILLCVITTCFPNFLPFITDKYFGLGIFRISFIVLGCGRRRRSHLHESAIEMT